MFKKHSTHDDLVEYIKKNQKKGYTRESLHYALINQGYSKLSIENAFKKVDEELASKAPILKTKPIIKYEVVNPVVEVEKKRRFFDFFK